MGETEVPSAAPADLSLRHVMLVGGTLAEWRAFGDEQWSARADELGHYLASLGVPWLTVRPYAVGNAVGTAGADVGGSNEGDNARDCDADSSGGDSTVAHFARIVRPSGQTPGCTVIIDPSADGRRRFAAAMRSLPLGDEVNEATVSSVLYEPADSEPDLVVVLGRSDQLPPSLVWEIAYAELYFADIAWSELTSAVLERAVGGFADRRRRFGGLPGVTDEEPGDYDSDEFESDEYDDAGYSNEGYVGDE